MINFDNLLVSGSTNAVKRFIKDLTLRLDAGWRRDEQEEGAASGSNSLIAIRTPDETPIADAILYFRLYSSGKVLKLTNVAPRPGVHSQLSEHKIDVIAQSFQTKFMNDNNTGGVKIGPKPVASWVQIRLEVVASRLKNEEDATVDFVKEVLIEAASQGHKPRILGRRKSPSYIDPNPINFGRKDFVDIDVLLREPLTVNTPAPSWIEEAFRKVGSDDFKYLNTSEVRGRYFGDLKIDAALYRWLGQELWYTHKGSEVDAFYSLIYTYSSKKKEARYEDFWKIVERAVRDYYNDTNLDSQTREIVLERCAYEARIIFNYERRKYYVSYMQNE